MSNVTQSEKKAGECGSRICSEPATVRVFWPGKTLDMCIECASRAEKIAEAMGFGLAVAPIVRLVAVGEA